MNIKLVFPPFSEYSIHGPHPAVHLLSSVLNSDGVCTEPVDLNIRLIRTIISDEVMDKILHIIEVSECKSRKEDAMVVKNFKSVPLEFFTRYSADGLINILQLIRKYLFPVPDTLEQCVDKSFERPAIVSELYLKLIKDTRLDTADAIGFSIAFAEQLPETVVLSRILKSVNPLCKIVIGGSQVTLLDDEQRISLKNTGHFDVIVTGECEHSITNIFKQVNTFIEARTVLSKPDDEAIIETLQQPEFADTTLYFKPLIIPLLVSKGCYWSKCAFCDYAQLSDKFRIRSVEQVFSEIKLIHEKYNPDTVFLISDAVPHTWYKSLCEEAVKNHVKLKTWAYMLHSETLNSGYFQLLSDAGVKTITFGTESVNDRILSLMGKNFSRNTVLQNLKDAGVFKFSVIVNIIPDFPAITKTEAEQILQDLILVSGSISSLNIQPFTLSANTRMAKYPDKFDIITDPGKVRSRHGFHSLNFVSKNGIDPDVQTEVMRKFHDLALKIKKKNLLKNIYRKDFKDNDILCFDPSAVLLTEESCKTILCSSINAKITIQHWEQALYNHIFAIPERRVSLKEFKNLFFRYRDASPVINFTAYFLNIINSGMIVKIN
ncbi:MAG: radical SAM protein [Bacteroidia bacterium]|nr:radical SAM protein [Bacteroidia bacterium]